MTYELNEDVKNSFIMAFACCAFVVPSKCGAMFRGTVDYQSIAVLITLTLFSPLPGI
jgi:hypothetical protein